MGTPSESNELDREVDAAMRMFEKSNVGAGTLITPTRPSRVLIALDGSPQDDTVVNAAEYLRETFSIEALILDARDQGEAYQETSEASDLAVKRAAEISGSRPIARTEADSYDAILAAVKEHGVDLVVLPCPFGRSFENVGTDSAGTVIDVLLSRCPQPMLVIRREDQIIKDCLASVRFVVGNESDVENRAASWAFGLASEKATITLNLVVEKEQYENIRAIVEAIHPEASLDQQQFSEALTKTHRSLHEGMAKTASSMGLTYHLQPQAGELAPPHPLNDMTKQILVMPVEVDDRFTQGFVQDRIRRSPHPILIVPGHVRADD